MTQPGVAEETGGHKLINDPPANALTRMRRLTCFTCGGAVMIRPDGSRYGSAVERTCEEQQNHNAALQGWGLV